MLTLLISANTLAVNKILHKGADTPGEENKAVTWWSAPFWHQNQNQREVVAS